MRRLDPSKVVLALEPPAIACSDVEADIPVLIRVTNSGRGVLKFSVDGTNGPPHDMSWLAYDVDVEPAFRGDWKFGPGDHGPMPPDKLRIDPGDSTTVRVYLAQVAPEDHARHFRIRLEDYEQGFVFTTEAFRPCVAAGRSPPPVTGVTGFHFR